MTNPNPPSDDAQEAGSAKELKSAGEQRQVVKPSAALKLLQFESEIRQLKTENALFYHMLSMTSTLCTYEVAMLFQWNENSQKYKAVQASNISHLDNDAPFVEYYLQQINQSFNLKTSLKHQIFNPQPDAQNTGNLGEKLHGLALVMPNREGQSAAIVMFLRASPFSEGEHILLQRLIDTYTHAWLGLDGQNKLTVRTGINKRRWGWVFAILSLCCFIPVKQSALVPIEVVADSPFIVTAPINGVVKKIDVIPNQKVAAGQTVLEFEDLQMRNDMETAKKKIDVARAREIGTTAAAFRDENAAHEMAIATAEYELAVVEYEFAKEVFFRTKVKAEAEGVVIFSDQRDIEGKPFSIGQEMLQIANPSKILYRIEIPVDSMLQLKEGDLASVFLQNSMWGGNQVQLSYISYKPKTLPSGQLGFVLYAKATDGLTPLIGSRGVAKISGKKIFLIVSLLARPITLVRQTIGI